MVSPKTNFYLWDKIANNNQDVGGIGIIGTNNVSNFDDAFRELMAQLATAFGSNLLSIAGDLFGLTLSNNVGDPVNDIDIATGAAASDGASPIIMTLASAITKRLDAAWAVGTNQGGLDTGAIANGTYHVWLIQRSDTSVVDVLFSLSATAPTMPANYDRKRRIGSILRESATIVPFSQNGDEFLRKLPASDIAVGIVVTTGVLAALSVPLGIRVTARIRGSINNGTTVTASAILLTSPDETDRAPTSGDQNVQVSVVGVPVAFISDIRVNTSAQIRYRCNNITTGLAASTYGWIDTRGRLG